MSLASLAFALRAARNKLPRKAAAMLAAAVVFCPAGPAFSASISTVSQSAPANDDGTPGTGNPADPAFADTELRTGEFSPDVARPLSTRPTETPDDIITGSTEIERITRINLPQASVDGLRNRMARDTEDEAPGIRLGTFVLRPALTEGIGYETQKVGGGSDERSFSQTTLRGTLTSDWSRHQLTVSGEGVWQENISGTSETEPSADIQADLRLDLAEETIAHITAGYTFFREDTIAPNATVDAAQQADVNTFTGGLSFERSLGLLRGRIGARAIRTTYGDVTLSDGTRLSQSDRNTTAGELTTRIGYELSPAIVPFVEGKYLRTGYDTTADAFGYRRASDTYTGETGVAVDFGEKLSGELAAGYVLRQFEDGRLSDVSGLAIDGNATWSPHRGTDVSLDLITALEESTTPGESGPIVYALRGTITREVRENVVARLGGGYVYRDYVDDQGIADEQVYSVTAGLTWSLNRYLALDGDVSFEQSRQPGSGDEQIAAVTVGLTIRR
jgi:hypothetical protein